MIFRFIKAYFLFIHFLQVQETAYTENDIEVDLIEPKKENNSGNSDSSSSRSNSLSHEQFRNALQMVRYFLGGKNLFIIGGLHQFKPLAVGSRDIFSQSDKKITVAKAEQI